MQLYCPSCNAPVPSDATHCEQCPALFTSNDGWKPINSPMKPTSTGHSLSWLFVWIFFTPFVAIIISFSFLCILDCAAGPWMTLKFAPYLTLLGWIIVGFVYSNRRATSKNK